MNIPHIDALVERSDYVEMITEDTKKKVTLYLELEFQDGDETIKSYLGYDDEGNVYTRDLGYSHVKDGAIDGVPKCRRIIHLPPETPWDIRTEHSTAGGKLRRCGPFKNWRIWTSDSPDHSFLVRYRGHETDGLTHIDLYRTQEHSEDETPSLKEGLTRVDKWMDDEPLEWADDLLDSARLTVCRRRGGKENEEALKIWKEYKGE